MSQLHDIRRRLRSIARRRFFVRCCAAMAAFLAAIGITLLVLFFLDRAFEMSRLQRVVSLGSAAVALYWATATYCLPLLRYRENELDIALLMARINRWDRDLVAALQFDDAQAARLGSPALRQAVIETVEASPAEHQLPRDRANGKLLRRLTALVLAASGIAAVCLTVPEATTIFPRRMLLSNVYYPRDTTVLSVAINGRPLTVTPLQASVPLGESATIEIVAQGVLPPSGTIQISRDDEPLQLLPVSKESDRYRATIPRLASELRAIARLGDAPPLEITIEVLSPPTVAIRSAVIVPEYARAVVGKHDSSLQFFNVAAGSEVNFEIESIDKPLASVRARFNEAEYDLVPLDETARRWQFQTLPTELQDVEASLEIVFDAFDRDGLPPTDRLSVRVGLLHDRPPRVTANALLRQVLPTARPTLEYEAEDEFELGEIEIHAKIVRLDSGESETKVLPQKRESGDSRTKRAGSVALELTPWNLRVGDRVEVTVVATDRRHRGEGQRAGSTPIVFEVAKLEEVMQSIRQLDRTALEDLDAIIERQLGVGAKP